MDKDFILKNEKLDELIGEGLYADAAEILFSSQINSWELMRENYAALKNVREKSFWFDSFKLKVQYNPKRIKSTSADVSLEKIISRPCFLCAENLPTEQKGLMLTDNYILLCNPYPIFPQHFTVSSMQHRSQSIQKNIKELLEITKRLSQDFTLIYNGPDCGASAPDHLHFQAGRRLLMPVENDIYQLKNYYGNILYDQEQNTISSIEDGLRTIIFIETLDLNSAVNLFEKFYRCYLNFSGAANEPLLNMLCSYNEEFGFSLIVFLRSRHRPQRFFMNGEGKLVVSPAAVDLGGLLIVPREEDFYKLNKELIKSLIREVSFEHSSFIKFSETLKNELN